VHVSMVTNSLSPSSEGDEAAVTDGGLKNLKRKPNPARIARIQAYARVQEAFRLDRKRCAGMILEGKLGQETTFGIGFGRTGDLLETLV